MFTDKPNAPQPAYADIHPTPFEILDKRAKGLFNGTAKLERLYVGCRWAEGPAWFAGGRYLVWSDIPNNRIMRWDETDGSVSVFRQPSNNTNGHTVDRQGRLVSCEHLGRRVTRTEHDGTITVLADRWKGKRLNSPNDVVVKSDGSIWFTDPAYGIDWDYEGERGERECRERENQMTSRRRVTTRSVGGGPASDSTRTAACAPLIRLGKSKTATNKTGDSW